jgi:2',3'-cyclic-nucleotide 2'-phosphodiesterase/3'-nucleotidase
VVRLIFALLLASLLQAQELRLQVLATTDTHGHVLPVDTYSLQPQAKGWAKLATLIRERKAANPNTLLLDCGDTLQGEPINYVRTRLHPELPEPALAVMNDLGYAAMTVGNHDFDWGLDLLRKAEKEARFPFLSANTLRVKDGLPAFQPYLKVDIGGVKVVVLGLTTLGVPRLVEPSQIAGLRFQDPVEAARGWVPRLRKEEQADVIVVSLHAGLGQLPGQSQDENCAVRLAEEVPGIDLLLAAHTHAAVQTTHKGVPILQAEFNARALAQAELGLHKLEGRWRIKEIRTALLHPMPETPLDPKVLELTETLRRRTDTYLDTFATNLTTDLDCRWARIEDTPIMQLIHGVQREATGAQLSAASVPLPRLFIPKGPTSIRQFWTLMPYENHVARIRINGTQLRAYLEHAAAAFHFSHEAGLFDPTVPFYNIDTVEGCSYALDLGKPVGERVVRLAYQGLAVRPAQEFTLALNTYRLFGGGGYLKAIGFSGKPEAVTELGLRNLIFQKVLSQPELGFPSGTGWRTVPYLDRERVAKEIR